jgi:IMP cyclohydrolase
MPDLMNLFSRMEYPGRVIILGMSEDKAIIALYAVTGRSPSSQARKFILSEDKIRIFVKPTDEKLIKTGQPELLIYPAVVIKNGIIISNGKHTEDIVKASGNGGTPAVVLAEALKNWMYEPDEPSFTPRISGYANFEEGALSIIKKSQDISALRYYFSFKLIPGTGKMIATYTGENRNPLPSFSGEPLAVDLPYKTAEKAVEALYEALGYKKKEDFRVSAASVFYHQDKSHHTAVKNRHN